MNGGRHSSRHRFPPAWLIVAGVTSGCAGIILLPVALYELFRYSPYEDPGAGTAGLWIAAAAALLTGVPAGIAAATLLIRAASGYLRWRRSLSPAQRAALAIAEATTMTAAHLAWRRHNREVSGRLTGSVMGEPRGDGFPGPG